jgi:hypothetical protein
MEALIVIFVLGILVLALVGAVRVLKVMFGSPELMRAPAARTDGLTRAEQLAVVWDVMGRRMPADLRAELARLRGELPSAYGEAPVIVAAPAVVAPIVTPPVVETPIVVAPVVAAPVLVEEPLRVPPEIVAAAPHAPSWLRAFLSFENTIFLLAACLVLGGTMYLVATTWGRVPGRWRDLFLEGVVLFYGSALLAAAAWLRRKLGLVAPARFLGATAALTSVGAAVAAFAAFSQSHVAGLVGAALAGVAGAFDARGVLRLEGRDAKPALAFGAALALLAGAGLLVAAAQPAGAAAVLLASVLVAGPFGFARGASATLPLRALSLGVPAATALLVAGGWLPAALVAPALVAAGALAAPAEGLALVALDVVALVVAGGHLLPSTATLGVALAIALARLAALPAAEEARPRRALAAALAAACWAGLAFVWAHAARVVGDGLGAREWAWTGASALPFALAPLMILRSDAGRGPFARRLALAAGGAIVAGALGLALVPVGTLGLPSVLTALGATALALAWARGTEADAPWAVVDALALLTVWLAVHALAPAFALGAVAAGAVGSLAARGGVHRVVGALVAPAALVAALAAGEWTAPLAALAAIYGALHLARPLGAEWTTRPLGPPALVAALALALLGENGAHAPLVALAHAPFVFALGLAPLVAWVVARGAPTWLALEALVGLAGVAVGGEGLLALGLATAMLLGRRPGAFAPVAGAVAPLAAFALAQGARPEGVGAALLVAGGAMLARPMPREDDGASSWIRWLALPALVGAVVVAALVPGAGHAARVSVDLWALVAAAAIAPFAGLAWREPSRVPRAEVIGAGALLAAVALVDAFACAPATARAIGGAAGALVGLAAALVAAHRAGGRVRSVAWVAALLLAPVAAVPMAASPLAPVVALVAVAAVVALGRVSKRLDAPQGQTVGAWALGATLPAAWWALAALAKQVSTGAPPEHLLPALGAVTAVVGIALAHDGPRFAAVRAAFVRRLSIVALALAVGFVAAGAGFVSDVGVRDAALTLGALALVAALALVIAFRDRAGWPFYVAEGALAAAYAYLRVCTPWLDALGPWDGVACCLGGFAGLAAERWLRAAREGLGAKESRFVATVLPVASMFFLSPARPLSALGPALGAAFLATRARDREHPELGWLAAVLANVSLIPLWAHLDVRSPVAMALPAGVTLGVLCDVYGARWGAKAGALRTLSAALCFGATSWEMFQFDAVWPAALLAATAVAAVLVGIRVRARAYLTTGFAALLVDLVANLGRWGLHDRLAGGALGLGSGLLLFGLGVVVSRHKELALARYRSVMAWPW